MSNRRTAVAARCIAHLRTLFAPGGYLLKIFDFLSHSCTSTQFLLIKRHYFKVQLSQSYECNYFHCSESDLFLKWQSSMRCVFRNLEEIKSFSCSAVTSSYHSSNKYTHTASRSFEHEILCLGPYIYLTTLGNIRLRRTPNYRTWV